MLAALASVVIAAQEPTISTSGPPPATAVKFQVETVVRNVRVPWEIVFTAPNRMLFTEREGRVRAVVDGDLRSEPLLVVEKVARTPGGENGLMGMCLHPDHERNRFVYLAYGYVDGRERDVRVVRYSDTGASLVEPVVILSGFPFGPNHAGCRIRFGPDGKLYITTGERFERDLAQSMTSLGGKILRVNDDGSAPEDNPFTGPEWKAQGARPEIWALGVRNPQGIDWQPGTGLLFETEHGPSVADGPPGGDELNIIRRGMNYGWPIVHHAQHRAGFESPLIEWTPAVAPASGMFYNGDLLPELKGSYLVGCLRGESIIRVVLDGERVERQETLLSGYGRIRALATGPDGAIYFSTSNRDGRGRPGALDDRICKIVPEEGP